MASMSKFRSAMSLALMSACLVSHARLPLISGTQMK
jgi:hypothetical protein